MDTCSGWEECLESLLSTIDQVTLRVKENKSAIGFTKKYLASLNPSIAEACVRSIYLADSVSTRGAGRQIGIADRYLGFPTVHCLNSE